MKACRTDSVFARIRESTPAAARSPFRDAMLSSEDVVGGRASLGHALGSSRTLFSPAIARKPTA